MSLRHEVVGSAFSWPPALEEVSGPAIFFVGGRSGFSRGQFQQTFLKLRVAQEFDIPIAQLVSVSLIQAAVFELIVTIGLPSSDLDVTWKEAAKHQREHRFYGGCG